jgi:hypothetical protein
MPPSTISGINRLTQPEKREIYKQIIPPEILDRFQIGPDLLDANGNDLFKLNAPSGSPSAESYLYHQVGFPDPILYGQVTDTLNGQLHVLLYVLNDPDGPRYDVDKMPDGSKTQFGTSQRNIPAEIEAMQAGLSPGQVRRGLRMLKEAMLCFEQFATKLGHDLVFAEPLFYHNAIIFERYGFSYQQGLKLMERIQKGFEPGGDLLAKLDGSTPFRQPEAANSIRLRSWAIHDGILGEPFTDVTAYKHVGSEFHVDTCPNCEW